MELAYQLQTYTKINHTQNCKKETWKEEKVSQIVFKNNLGLESQKSVYDMRISHRNLPNVRPFTSHPDNNKR